MEIFILILAALLSLAGGVFCLIQYKKTKNKLFLASGILLTFIVPGILLFLAFRTWSLDTMVIYGPEPMMDYGPMLP